MMELQMRVMESEIGNVVPVVDIADAIGYSRAAITKIMKDKENLFTGTKVFRPLPTAGGNQQFLCVNRAGLDIIMVLLKPAKSRDSFEKFLVFREQALNRLGGNGGSVSNGHNGNGHDLKAEMERARLAAEATGGNLVEFQKIAMKKCGFEEFIPALTSTSVVHGDVGEWMNPTDIGRECGLKAHEVNGWLYNKGFQWPDHGIWRLTDRGEVYGEEYQFQTTSRHSEIRIRWHRSILVASGLKKPDIANLLPAPGVA